MKKSKVNILEWPTKSPDLNIVEYIWEQLSNDIYDCPQFKKISDLREKINRTILHFNLKKRENIKELYQTIRQRICNVLLKNGNMPLVTFLFLLLYDCVKNFGQNF